MNVQIDRWRQKDQFFRESFLAMPFSGLVYNTTVSVGFEEETLGFIRQSGLSLHSDLGCNRTTHHEFLCPMVVISYRSFRCQISHKFPESR